MSIYKNGRTRWSVGVAMIFLCATQAISATVPDDLICGFDNVEDLVPLRNSAWIIGSGIGDNFFQRGGLHLFNEQTSTGRKVLLHLSPDLKAEAPYDQCPGPADDAKFSAHGLALKAGRDGTQTLFAVNHGGRESIEIFRVTPTKAIPRINWIGCVLSPPNGMANALAVRDDGSMVMSASVAADAPLTPVHIYADKGVIVSKEQAEASVKQEKRGALFIWTRQTGWKKVPGSELVGNNGIELAKGEKWAFVDSHPGASVTYMPLEPGLGSKRDIRLSFHPDNIRYGYDGALIATGHLATPEEVGVCVVLNNQHCTISYRSARIDPKTFAVTEMFDGRGTPDFGLATTGLRTRDALWLSPVRGRCVARVRMPLLAARR